MLQNAFEYCRWTFWRGGGLSMRAKSNIICPPAHNLSLLYFTKCLKPSLNYWIQLQEMHIVVDQVSSTDIRFRYWNYCYFMLCYIHGFQTCNLMLPLKSIQYCKWYPHKGVWAKIWNHKLLLAVSWGVNILPLDTVSARAFHEKPW